MFPRDVKITVHRQIDRCNFFFFSRDRYHGRQIGRQVGRQMQFFVFRAILCVKHRIDANFLFFCFFSPYRCKCFVFCFLFFVFCFIFCFLQIDEVPTQNISVDGSIRQQKLQFFGYRAYGVSLTKIYCYRQRAAKQAELR